jgi:hypothetical protein
MKDPKEMRARAERYRRHAQAITDPDVKQVIRSVADNLERDADRIERGENGGPKSPWGCVDDLPGERRD